MNLKEHEKPKKLLLKRKFKIRKKIFGNKECPRVSVYKSLRHIYAQAIDDTKSHTLAQCSTLCKEIKDELKNKTKTQQSLIVGQHLAKKLSLLGIKKIIFDRNGRKYAGRISMLAQGLRSSGIEF